MKTEMKTDAINPEHYQSPGGVQAIEVTQFMSFCLGNSVKYIWRSTFGVSRGTMTRIVDLKKAVWYLEKEIDRLESLDQ